MGFIDRLQVKEHPSRVPLDVCLRKLQGGQLVLIELHREALAKDDPAGWADLVDKMNAWCDLDDYVRQTYRFIGCVMSSERCSDDSPVKCHLCALSPRVKYTDGMPGAQTRQPRLV